MYIINTLFVHSIFIDQFLISHKTGGKNPQKKIIFQKQFKNDWLHWKNTKNYTVIT